MGWTYHGDGVMSRIRPTDKKQIVYIRFWFEGREIKERVPGYGAKALEQSARRRDFRRQQIEEGSYQPPEVRKKEVGPTFREFVTKRFLKEHASRGGSTYYEDVLLGQSKKKDRPETVILKYFGDKLITKITRADLDRFRAKRSKEVAPGTVRKNLMVLGTIFRKAVEWGVIRNSPAAMMAKPSEPKHKVAFLSRDEWDTLLATAQEYQGGWLAPILTLATFTGMRLKEVIGLRWGDVNWKTDMIELGTDNKTATPRPVPMNKTVRRLLERDLGGRFHRKTEFVFVDDAREPFSTREARNRVSQRAKDVFRAAGMGQHSFHVLRHTAASWMVQAGRPLAEVRDVLGHANMQTTLRYAHLQPEHLRAAVNALDAPEAKDEDRAKEA